jgi:ankyrin repeat protein
LGYLEAIKVIVNNFVEILDIHRLHDRRTLYHSVVLDANYSLERKREICRILVEKGFYLNQRSSDGSTALGYALCKKDTEIAIMLLDEFGADPRLFVRGPLCPIDYVIIHGDPVVLASLLSHGAVVSDLAVMLAGRLRNERHTRDSKLSC